MNDAVPAADSVPFALDAEISLQIGRLGSHPESVRRDAVQRLAAIGRPAIGPLGDVLRSENDFGPRTRALAAEALALIGPAAIAELVTALFRRTSQELASHSLIAIGEPAVAPLIDLLESKHDNARHAAASCLEKIGTPSAVTALKEVFIKDVTDKARRKFKRNRRLRISIAAFIALFLFSFVGLHWWKQAFPDTAFAADLCRVFAQIVLQAIVFGSAVDTAVGIRNSASIAVARMDDVRNAPLFALCLDDKEKLIRQTAVGALKKLLPRVQASQAPEFSPEAMAALIKALSIDDEELVLAVLTALEQIGDERALPAVEGIAERSPSNSSLRIRAAAKESLPALRVRAAESLQASSLLRAASSPNDSAATMLVRPAESATVNPEQLVRSVAV